MPATLTRLTARSVVLSVLLGTHPARADAAELLSLTADFGIKESALRVALTRMVGAGDLIRAGGGYQLSDRLLARQRRQDQAMHPQTHPWDGNWTTVLITAVGEDARTRAALRTALSRSRFGELREGVWLRPDNLVGGLDPEIGARARVLTARDDDPVGLARQLWDLPGWAQTGARLLESMAHADDVPGRFTVAAAIVRHLRSDPVLPDGLLPADWPGRRLRRCYDDFAAELDRRRNRLREAR